MHLTSPSLGIYLTTPGTPSRGQEAKWRRSRYVTKSAPANTRHRRQPLDRRMNSRGSIYGPVQRPETVSGFRPTNRPPPTARISVEDVVSLAEHAREVSSLENRRHVMEEAQRAVRHEVAALDSSRPQSVVGVGLQAMTSPMPLSAKSGSRFNQMDHIPTLLPLPSDRTFIPSPDQDHHRHMTTPVDDLVLGERSQSVARQCCEIMGASRCQSCRKLESRLLNREKAEQECPRMRLTQQNISMTQIVKRFYPYMTEAEIQDKIARGEIARARFLSARRRSSSSRYVSGDESDEHPEDDSETVTSVTRTSNTSESGSVVKKKGDNKENSTRSLLSTNPIYLLAKLTLKLKGEPSTPLFFTNLKRMQSKILSGQVERKVYMNTPKQDLIRLKSAVSTVSTASSGKSNLSKIGSKLSAEFMPAFVSPRKVKIMEEPKYKVYFGPPLLSRRRQIPNPSFFAGSKDEYSLPERLPDVIEFADSQKIAAMEKQARAASAMSLASNLSEDVFDYDKMSALEKSDDGRPGSRVGRTESPAGSGSGGPELTRSMSTPRLMRVSTEGALSGRVVEEEDEHNHDQCAEEESRTQQDESATVEDTKERHVNVQSGAEIDTEATPSEDDTAAIIDQKNNQPDNDTEDLRPEADLDSQAASFFVTENHDQISEKNGNVESHSDIMKAPNESNNEETADALPGIEIPNVLQKEKTETTEAIIDDALEAQGSEDIQAETVDEASATQNQSPDSPMSVHEPTEERASVQSADGNEADPADDGDKKSELLRDDCDRNETPMGDNCDRNGSAKGEDCGDGGDNQWENDEDKKDFETQFEVAERSDEENSMNDCTKSIYSDEDDDYS